MSLKALDRALVTAAKLVLRVIWGASRSMIEVHNQHGTASGRASQA